MPTMSKKPEIETFGLAPQTAYTKSAIYELLLDERSRNIDLDKDLSRIMATRKISQSELEDEVDAERFVKQFWRAIAIVAILVIIGMRVL